MFNIKKLFQSKKLEMQIPLNTLYGYKYLFHVTNLALFCIVIILSIISASIYFLMPVIDVSELSGKVDIQEAEKMLHDQGADETIHIIGFTDTGSSEEEQHAETYTIISEKNVFSPQRKDWVVKKVIPKLNKSVNKKMAKRWSVIGKPKKIILHGIVIAGEMRKALIKNPMTGVSKKKTIYVEEGEEIEGYRVISIESDLIRLDWQGEEIVVTLYSGLNDYEQADNIREEEEDISEMEHKHREPGTLHAVVDTDEVNEKTDDSFAEISDEMPINLMSMEPEHFFMPVINAAKLSEEVEIQDVAETFPYIEFIDVGSSEEEPKTMKAKMPKSVDLAAEEELKQKALSEKPIKIVLYGIVVAGDIKKALVNIPITGVSKNRALYVEEGDRFEGYEVTSIEPDRLRLDWQGEEMVVIFPPL